MSTNNYHSLGDVRPGSFDWNVRVRIVRLWRGVSKTGEGVKGFSILILDDKNFRLHAFIPGSVADKIEKKIKVGKIHIISNFTVKDYKAEEKFRCIRSEIQIIFTPYTEVEAVDDNDMMIPNNMFDFYDLEDLIDIANDNTYLTDVIGVIEKDMPLRRLTNKHGVTQSQIKFEITDGRCTKQVTFWDRLAEQLERDLTQVTQFPAIIIIASAKIASWQGSTSNVIIDIGNATPTHYYINYDHHSVTHMRRMFSTPLFSKHDFSNQVPEHYEVLTIKDIKEVGNKYVKKEVVCELKITSLDDTLDWFYHVCTSCFREIDCDDGKYNCKKCLRNVPYLDQKFRISANGMDISGNINLDLFDREVQSLIGKNVFDLEEEGEGNGKLPVILKTIEQRNFTVKLIIREDNIWHKSDIFFVTDIYPIEMHHETLNEVQDMVTQSQPKIPRPHII